MLEITLANHQAKDFLRFETAVQTVPEITECWAIGGGMDYILKIVVNDVDTYQKLLDRLLADEIGIDRYFSYIVTKSIKSKPPSLDNLIAD